MGEYNLVPNNGQIVIDGHVCVNVCDDVYKVADSYVVNISGWCNDEANTGLFAVIKIHDITDKFGSIKYIATESRASITSVMDSVRGEYDSDLLLTYGPHRNTDLEYDLTVLLEGELYDV